MTIIIRNNTVITTNTSYSEQVQIASGATLTILPGVSINLNGNKMLIAGSLNLSGSATNFSNITNGTISTENTSGSIIATNAKFSGVTIDDFFSDGSIQVTSSVFESSSVRTLPSSVFTSVLFTNTTLNISGTKGGSFIHDTFLNSPMSIMAWFGGSQTSISDSNFIGIGNVITLDPFFSGNGSSHNISITNSYIAGVTGPAIDGKIFDADDDIRVSTDITPSSFTSSPYVNDVNGFRIGNTLVSLNQLGVIDSTAPIVSTFTPADSSISAPITSNISLHFNEVIQKGAGIIAIHSGSAGGTVVESFNATNSSRLTILGNTLTINPTNNLANNTHYFVTFASGTVKDLAGNNYLGTSSYDFTTVKNTITGTNGNDSLVGTNGDDILIGLAGNDVLNGGLGADQMTGGDGSDVYYVDNIGDVVTETNVLASTGGTDLVNSYLSAYTLGANVENGRILATGAANLSGNTLNNVIYAGSGINRIDGLGGTDTLSFQFATTTGLPGVTLNLSVLNGSGQSTASGISGADLIKGIENIIGSNYNDTLTGNAGNNVLNGLLGADKLTGGLGNDTYYVDNIGDVVTETSALLTEIDTVYSAVTYTLGANIENLTLIGAGIINGTGNALNNTLTGNAAANILSGLAGNDVLNGGLGADQMNGGKGQDNLTGGAGRDTFTFAAGDDGITATTLDKILDYAKGAVGTGDLIDYSATLTKGGNANIATASQASINQSRGIATFANGSGTTLADAVGDITARFTAATDTAGEFAFFRVNNTGDNYLFVSDGTAGAGVNDDVIQLVGVTSIGAIDLNGGNLTITS